jgi:hypothetical protein
LNHINHVLDIDEIMDGPESKKELTKLDLNRDSEGMDFKFQ